MTGDRPSRRAFLRRGAAVALPVGLAGCQFREDVPESTSPGRERPTDTPTPATPTSRERLASAYGDRFDEYVDVVAAGASPDGSEPIDDVLEQVVADDTLVYVPAGTYRVNSLRVEGVSNAALVAESPDETSLVPGRPAVDIGHQFLQFHGVSDFLFEGFTLDYRASGAGGATQVFSRGDFAVRDLRVRGTMPDESLPGNPAAFRFDVRDEAASGTVKNVVATDGGHDGGNAVGLYVGAAHAGTLEFVDCEVSNFPNNGLYASAPGRDDEALRGRDGTVHVRGGRYANNNIANVRLGSTDSTARDVTVVVDERPPSHAGAMNARGIRLRNRSGIVVEDCDIVIGEDAGEGFGGLVFHPNAGTSTIRDTTIRVDRDGTPAIRALDDDPSDASPGPTFENVTVSGAAAGGWAVEITGRADVAFEDCTVSGSGPGRNGLSFTACENCVVDGGEIDVPGIPVRGRRSTVETLNVQTDGAVENDG
jgi:hypothetical protein